MNAFFRVNGHIAAPAALGFACHETFAGQIDSIRADVDCACIPAIRLSFGDRGYPCAVTQFEFPCVQIYNAGVPAAAVYRPDCTVVVKRDFLYGKTYFTASS